MLSAWQNLPSWWPAAMAIYGLLLLLLVWTDLFRSRVVPHVFSLPLILVAAALLWAGPGTINNVLAGAAAALAFYIVCAAGKMAWGDFWLIVPLAAMAGSNFLFAIFLGIALTLPFNFRVHRLSKHEKLTDGNRLLSDKMAPFGPGAVAGAQIVFLLMGLPLWVGGIWAAGWLVMLALGVRERKHHVMVTPQQVRDWAGEGRQGDLKDLGRMDWIMRIALLNALVDDAHWPQLHDVKPYETLQPLSENPKATTLYAQWRGNYCHLALIPTHSARFTRSKKDAGQLPV